MDALPAHFQVWLASNLLAGCSAETVHAALVQAGVPAELAQQELTLAQQHPYLAVARTLKAKLDRRESLLKTLDGLQRQDPGYLRVDRQPLPPYAEFLRRYFVPSRVGLFSGAIEHWAARHWTPRGLLEQVPAATPVEIQFDREQDPRYESNSARHKRELAFGDFIAMVEQTRASNNFYLTANNLALRNTALGVLLRDTANLGDGYLDLRAQGGTHLWIGPQGVITPLHHDLTHNLFVQIHGRKRFRLIPALQAPYMHNELHVYSEVDLLAPQPDIHPQFARTTVIEIEVGPGDLLFIPAGWWHHVSGLSPSISLSFTNLSGVANGFVDFPVA